MSREPAERGKPPGPIALYRLVPLEGDPAAVGRLGARLAVEALARLDDLVEPLGAVITAACADPETLLPARAGRAPSRRAVLLARDGLPDGVTAPPLYADAEARSAPRLDAAAILEVVDQVQAQPCPGAGVAAWEELFVTAAAVRLPPGLARSLGDGGALRLRAGAGHATVPVQRRGGALWVAGPRQPDTLRPAFEIGVRNDAGLLCFGLLPWWTLWDGDRLEAELCERLGPLGWTQEPPP